MISVDTDVLLRRLLHDDPEQTRKVTKLFEASGQVLITDVVLAETLWILSGKKYQIQKDDLVRAIGGLLEEPNVVFESRQAVWSGLCDFQAATGAKEGVSLADTLILNKAKVTARVQGVVFKGHYTFDTKTQALTGTKRP